MIKVSERLPCATNAVKIKCKNINVIKSADDTVLLAKLIFSSGMYV